MAPGRNQHPSLSLQLCTKYQVKYSCLGPDKSLRLHSVCSSDYIILCAYILDLLVPLPTYIIKIHIRFFHPFPGEKVFNVKENFWRFPLIEISAVMMWCEILDNLQFNKFLWNEWSLIVWCEAARRREGSLVMLCHPVNNCNNFLPLPTRPHIIRHLVFPWESVLRSQVTTQCGQGQMLTA